MALPDTSSGTNSLTDWLRSLFEPADAAFVLSAPQYDSIMEREIESRFTVANGFIGVRGSLELPTRNSRPRTYVAGFFDGLHGSPTLAALISAPDWIRLQISVDGAVQSLAPEAAARSSRKLDLCRGLLLSDWEFPLVNASRLRLRCLRLASLVERRLGLQLLELSADGPLTVQLRAPLQPPTSDLVLERSEQPLLFWRTTTSERQLATAINERLLDAGATGSRSGTDGASPEWRLSLAPGEELLLLRCVVFASGGDEEAARRAADTLRRVQAGPRQLLAEHEAAWAERWRASDIIVEGDDAAQQALRFALYHIAGAANPESETTSIGARGLTGDGYLGHVFWDTETFVLPVLTHTWPEAARTALMYRYHTLPAARRKATRYGYRGALYAWESADTGDEVTPSVVVRPDGTVLPIMSGVQEHHISADIAYAVWHYWEATQDASFLLGGGAEILLETSRFWYTRASLEDDGHYHVRGVIGPDEYHEDVDDNAYTNEMARWNLECGVETAELLREHWPDKWEELRKRLELTALEIEAWRVTAEGMALLLDPETLIYEQFEGFHQLQSIDLKTLEPRMSIVELVLGTERTRHSQVVKQADVVMMLALLWDRFTPEERLANFRHYEPLSSHDSSLSPAVHALVAARLGDVDMAYSYFEDAMEIDLSNAMGNTGGGVHIGALGGAWQAVVFGFAGMSVLSDGISFDPHLPRHWTSLAFPVQWRGRRLKLGMTQEPPRVEATLESGEAMVVRAWGVAQEVRRGETRTWSLEA